jgi:hypothetical protein
VTLTPQGGATQTQTVTTSPVAFSGLTAGTQYTATIRSSCSAGGTGQRHHPHLHSARSQLDFAAGVAPDGRQRRQRRYPLSGSYRLQPLLLQPDQLDFSGTVPAYSATIGQAFAPANDGGSWGNTSNLSTPRYQEYTVTATGSYAVRVDSLTFATGILSSAMAAWACATRSTALPPPVSERLDPARGCVGQCQHSGFTNAFSGLRNLPVAPAGGSSLTAADTYHLALNGATGVALLPGQTLTIRLYYAVGSGSTARYALLRDVKVKGQATFTAPVCNDPIITSFGPVTFTSTTLNFTAGAGNSSYIVTLTPQGGSTTTVTPAPTASPVSLTGLTPGTNYTVTLQANCAAAGMQSAVQSATFRTPALPLQKWPLRVSSADTAALRSVAVTPSTATLRRFVASSASSPADYSGKYGHAFAPWPPAVAGARWAPAAAPPAAGIMWSS